MAQLNGLLPAVAHLLLFPVVAAPLPARILVPLAGGSVNAEQVLR